MRFCPGFVYENLILLQHSTIETGSSASYGSLIFASRSSIHFSSSKRLLHSHRVRLPIFSSWQLLDRASSSSANFHPSSIIISHQTHSRSFAPCGSPIRQHVQLRVISKGLLTVRFVLVLDIPLDFLIFIAWSLYFLRNKLINHFFIPSVM